MLAMGLFTSVRVCIYLLFLLFLLLSHFLRISCASAKGFFLPLSGGADSAATCAMVGIMCKMVLNEIHEKHNEQVILDTMRIADFHDRKELPRDHKVRRMLRYKLVLFSLV
jgi:hypothetical protein